MTRIGVLKFLHLLFENEVLGYKGGTSKTIVNNSSNMDAMQLRLGL